MVTIVCTDCRLYILEVTFGLELLDEKLCAYYILQVMVMMTAVTGLMKLTAFSTNAWNISSDVIMGNASLSTGNGEIFFFHACSFSG